MPKLKQLKKEYFDLLDILESPFVIAKKMAINKKYGKHKKTQLTILGSRQNEDFAKSLEPLGDFFLQLLELAIQCSVVDSPYVSPNEWWSLIVQDFVNYYLNLFNEKKNKTTHKKSYSNFSKLIENTINTLIEGKNPVNKETFPHLFLLLEKALFFSQYENFETKYFNPFLKSMRALPQSYLKDWQKAWIEDNCLIIQSGKGKTTHRYPIIEQKDYFLTKPIHSEQFSF